ncbi:uncharacterized protein LOC110908495 isoform X4 [Helianthus annuus]|uniref:uncharacterized protein LOC110908495 isoform X4 n=1 Tax=Helianthus annuus TaxID=4232 RepID=UPI000B8F1E85|nr:uncharacterized protein LOC110908495 isoform X4 [Helianthus annuus]
MASIVISWLKKSKNIGAYYGVFLPATFLLCLALLIGAIFVGKDHRERSIRWGIDVIRGSLYANVTSENLQPPPTPQQPTWRPQLQPLPPPPPPPLELQTPPQPHDYKEEQMCLSQSQYRLPGSEPLPKGLVANTSDLQMQPLWGRRKKVNSTTSLFTAAVGIKQKETVDKMVRKFLSSDFSVMLFHYDGVVDAWKDLEWADNVVHVSAVNQTKWWFAKRFLHPDIVTEYSYIFVWDEDLGVDNFDPDRYLSIVKDEGLEISQPALDTELSEVHHTITARWRNSIVHRRVKPDKHGCDPTNDYPPCTGWVELMAPVFSRAAWQCIWCMIQSDLNHAWGLDILFGYCAQGDRTKNVGVVDAEYIVHYGIPTFGELQNKEKNDASEPNARLEVRRQSHHEYKIFKRRWQEAAKEDESWVDPYPYSWNYSIM